MIDTFQYYLRLWKYKRYFRDAASSNNRPDAIGHIVQLNETVEQVDQKVAEASIQVENAARLYQEILQEFMNQEMDARYPEIATRRLEGAKYKYSYQTRKLHSLERMYDAFVELRNYATVIGGFDI